MSILKMMTAMSAFALIPVQTAAAQPSEEVETMDIQTEAQQILQAFADDYRDDPSAISGQFGIKLNDHWWTVTVERAQEAYRPESAPHLTFHNLGPHRVTLAQGQPSTPTWYFEIADINVLRLIASGDVNAGTASMQSFGSDEVGVETREMEGFTMTSGHEADLYLALSHFFSTGTPEVTRFSRDASLPTHGAAAVALHMMKGFRIMWFSIGPNEVVNEDPRLEFGQMPNLFVITRGRGQALLGDRDMELSEGMSVFVAPYVRHVIRNPYDEPLEGILVLYGDNSDFAFGTSYPEFLEDLNGFYRNYTYRRETGAEEAGE